MKTSTEWHTRLAAEARKFVKRQLDGDPVRADGLAAITSGPFCGENGGAEPSSEWLNQLENRMLLALARERGKARTGHAGYDANRHIALHQALKKLRSGRLGGAGLRVLSDRGPADK